MSLKIVRYTLFLPVLFFLLSISSTDALSAAKANLDINTVTVDSKKMGFVVTPAVIRLITQDGSGTVNDGNPNNDNYFPVNSPGSFTSDPFGCIFTSADFGQGAGGCTNIESNGPVTAGSGIGNDVKGVIKSSVSMNFSAAGDSGSSLEVTGSIDFTLCATCNSDSTLGTATLSQHLNQQMDFGNAGGTTSFLIDNRNKDASPITFTTCADPNYSTCTKVDPATGKPTLVMNIPWSLDISQNLNVPGGSFQTASEGIFRYEVQKTDNTIHSAYVHTSNATAGQTSPCVGLGMGAGGSCWPAFGSFDLPGFDMSAQRMGNGSTNFPSPK